jgi:NADP-dependent 3-hydroxy acid dehydrogenase YdfG
MNEFRNKVAVITGAASGIGKAIARRCVIEEMKVVLADIEEPALMRTASEFEAGDGNILPIVTDVSRFDDVQALAQKTSEMFGAVHLLCNNAGVGAGSTAWETTTNDWQWTLGVNLWGVIHGIQAFLPIMLAQEAESYVINTSSIAGLLPYHAGAPYQVSKHAVVALSEKLFYDLGGNKDKIKVSVLCPGWVQTRILEAERNRPSEFHNDPDEIIITPEMLATIEEYQQSVTNGMPPDEIADQVFAAISMDQFYILTHPEFMPLVKARLEVITKGQNPLPLVELQAMLNN